MSEKKEENSSRTIGRISPNTELIVEVIDGISYIVKCCSK